MLKINVRIKELPWFHCYKVVNSARFGIHKAISYGPDGDQKF